VKHILNAEAKSVAKFIHPWVVHQLKNPNEQTFDFRLLKQRVQNSTGDSNSRRVIIAWVVEQWMGSNWDKCGKKYRPTENIKSFCEDYIYCEPHTETEYDINSSFYQLHLKEILYYVLIHYVLDKTGPRHNGII
jgi:hypothetical protein